MNSNIEKYQCFQHLLAFPRIKSPTEGGEATFFFQNEWSSTGKRLLIEIFLEEFKPLALETKEFKYLQSNNGNFSAYQENCNACQKFEEFHFEHTSTDRNLSFNNLMEEVKSIVMEKYAF